MMSAIVTLAVLIAAALIVAVATQEHKKGGGTMGVVKIAYVLAIVAFLMMFVAFGISAFYQPPQDPSLAGPIPMPEPPQRAVPPERGTPEYEQWQAQQAEQQEIWQKQEEENRKSWDVHRERLKTYRRNVFLIAYPFGLLFAVLGLQLRPRLDILRPGLLLGGIGVIIYAIAQSDLTAQVRFGGVAFGLALLIFIGYKTLLEKRPASEE